MGALTYYLQQEFATWCPAGWTCHRESRLLTAELERTLGYAPRADVLLERVEPPRRLWIEFEVSRADPVANHAKFATAHLFQPQDPTDTFLSMVSPHVTRGRRNLAANTVSLMRHLGMSAFQTVLFPHLTPGEIKRLNHLSLRELRSERIDVSREIARALDVSEPLRTRSPFRIHRAGDLLDVVLNVGSWNRGIDSAAGRAAWGRRIILYFVFDPESTDFAPSKFCAYLPVIDPSQDAPSTAPILRRPEMTLTVYSALDQREADFDGARARVHLTRALGMRRVEAGEDPIVDAAFGEWLRRHSERIGVHLAGPVFLIPPAWFR